MHEDANKHGVLDDVGEIAGVKGVAIVHGAKSWSAKRRGAKPCTQFRAHRIGRGAGCAARLPGDLVAC
jgi:hypothetical protein